MSAQRVIALLGRRDEPTDAVEEYCRHLGEALVDHEFHLEIRRVPWNEHGWSRSLEALRFEAQAWQGVWVLVQYTALAWSARGVPRGLLQVLRLLSKAGARVAVVFHDAGPFGGSRLMDRFRRASQVRVMRNAIAFSDHAVFTVPPNCLSWVNGVPDNSSFIVVGPNLPQALLPQNHQPLHEPPSIGVFSITGGAAGDQETRDIVAAVRLASEKLGKLRLLVFGRHAELREADLREGLRGLPVELVVEGVIDGEELADRFSASDVLLFVRGTISSRRGSAIAGISCGVPVIALQGPETAAPITDSGVILLPLSLGASELPRRLAGALIQVLSDAGIRTNLIRRSRQTYQAFFSWSAIASRYADFLKRS